MVFNNSHAQLIYCQNNLLTQITYIFLAGNQYNIMIIITAVWLCLITHVVYGGTMTTNITVNNNCSDSDKNCKGSSSCSSLPCALKNMKNNIVINITSKVVTLNDIVGMGSGNLSNITIIGNGATIMCNNTGGVYCESCSNITIMGITWYQCGRRPRDPGNPTTQTAGLAFTNVSNITIHNCTFQNSSGCPVYINNGRESITIKDSWFVENSFNAATFIYSCAGLLVYNIRNNLNVSIISSGFYSNGCGLSNECFHYGVVIDLEGYRELANVVIQSTEFSNNSRGLYFESGATKSTLVQLSNVNVYNNTACGIFIGASAYDDPTSINIDISFANLMNNMNPLSILTPLHVEGQCDVKIVININNSIINGNSPNDYDININQDAKNLGVLRIALTSSITLVIITITNSHFYNNFNGAVGIHILPNIGERDITSASITFTNVTIYNTTAVNDKKYVNIASVYVATINTYKVTTKFNNVNFISNNYSRANGAVLLIENNEVWKQHHHEDMFIIEFTNCIFHHNVAIDHVVFLNVITNNYGTFGTVYTIWLSKCKFDNNIGGESIVHARGPISHETNVIIAQQMVLENSIFSNNKGTAVYSIIPQYKIIQNVLFINNTANSGAAVYFEELHFMILDDGIQFINNSVVQKGGALYFNLATGYCNVFISSLNEEATFINNSADIAGNSIYFSIPQSCKNVIKPYDKSSLPFVPNKYKFSQPVYIKSQPIVTSPCNIKLYPPAIAVHNSSNDYTILQSKMLGEPIQFTASVLDYFNNITEPVIFTIKCKTCSDDYVLSTYQITVHNHTLNEIKVFPTVPSDVGSNINISITMLSVLSPVYKSISASLSVELSPCRTGYLFDNSQQCVCYPYPDIIHCTEEYSEIKIGYWIGFLTSSICPSNYCNFAKRTETNPGYYDLPRTPDGQCSSHRTGVACGECKLGYTLAYDSPKCLNKDNCSAGMIFLVIVLTILYWIGIVAGVFCLMYFWFKIPLGYVYAVIYYYSIVDILLVDDLSNTISQLVNILSSFAKLTPPLLGQLCLVEGLSGIDQQFIHYSHALAVSLILLIIVLAARYSGRLTRFISPCIIRVICLLLLLSYTSLASTSLQLLRPLTFNDVDEACTYSSPDIKYFTGRHLAYAIVAILCEMIIVIGLPLLLLLEPFLSQRINFVKIKPLLDEF